MSLSSHLQELKRKHSNLSSEVEEAQRAPGVDDLHVAVAMSIVQWRASPPVASINLGTLLYQVATNFHMTFRSGNMQGRATVVISVGK